MMEVTMQSNISLTRAADTVIVKVDETFEE